MDNWLKLFPEVDKLTFLLLHQKLENIDIPIKQAPYLMCISRFEGCSQDKLVKFMRIDKGCVAKTIKQLEDKGYVKRNEDPKDKRGYKLYLTEKSNSIVEEFKVKESEIKKIVTKGMSEEEVETMINLLSRAAVNLYSAVDCPYPPISFCKNLHEKGEN
ncbi:MAG: MarR family transcriptional regulator [Anaerovoracaceae bacterium]